MRRNYGTSSSLNDVCVFKKDYSYVANGRCLECQFCYKLPGGRPKIRSASLLPHEGKISPSLYTQPITISRYCEPFYNATSTKHSINAMNHILSNGGSIILRTSQANIPDKALELMNKYINKVQFQPRFISSSMDNGTLVKNILAPKFSDTHNLIETSKQIKSIGIDVSAYFDPYILLINDADCNNLIKELSSINVNKLIIKQLFATSKFKSWLRLNGSSRSSYLLNVPVKSYWTYSNDVLFRYISNTLEVAYKENVSVSVCSNKECNTIINGCNNCCQFTKGL